MSLRKFISKKKNQQLILLVIAIIMVYFWWKKRTKATVTNFGSIDYPNARVDNSGGNNNGGGGNTDPEPEEPEESRYLFAPTQFVFRQTDEGLANFVRNSDGTYSDNIAGDVINGSNRTRVINGENCRAHYFINGSPLENQAGQQIDFVNITLADGQYMAVEKIYMKTSYTGTNREMFEVVGRQDIKDAFVKMTLKHFTT